MERLHVIGPALALVGAFMLALSYYSVLCLLGKRPPKREHRERGNAFDFFIHFFLWLIEPLERALIALRLRPNTITLTSMLVCAATAVAIALGHMATAGWLYITAGGLDILDGRLARARGQSSNAGALLDSVSDRWGELFVFSGFAWFLHESPWMFAALLALAGSMMVSYTRARGESLGVNVSGGTMQRAERIALVSVSLLITAWFNSAANTAEYGKHVIGVALLITGVLAASTALGRWVRAYRTLKSQENAGSTPDSPDVGVRPSHLRP